MYYPLESVNNKKVKIKTLNDNNYHLHYIYLRYTRFQIKDKGNLYHEYCHFIFCHK